MRSRTPSEYEPPPEFTTPKRPLFERGWHGASRDGGLPYQDAPCKACRGHSASGESWVSLPYAHRFPPALIRAAGGLSPLPPFLRGKGDLMGMGCAPSPQTGETAAGEAPMIVNSLSRLAAAAPLPKEPFGLCALERWPNTNPRQSSPLPNAPFLKGGGSAQALPGDCRIRMRPAKHAGGIAQAGKAGFLYPMPTGSPLRSSARLAAYPPCPLSCAERGGGGKGLRPFAADG